MRSIALALVILMAAGCGIPRYVQPPDTYVVRSGDTLFSIAWRYDLDPARVARWNNLGDGSLIHPGDVLRLSPPSGSAARTTATTSRTTPKPLPEVPNEPPPTWTWPVSGPISVEFGGKPGTGTGILIDGKLGQPIVAAASGRIVYAGSGLIGYGQLIIVKHNDTYLSAYGYNASLLVKEGETIRRGQRIATMGEGPERKARLHFEIRRNGKPVNPRQYMPAR